jgi:hypothetical protein
MRLGLLADIHEAVEPLAAALRELRARRVDSFVMLGDVVEAGERIDETVALLAELPGGVVWGNHGMGLCGVVPATLRARLSSATLAYFARLRPWYEVEGYRFQHIDPHLDPEDFEDLWRFPSAEERIAGLAKSAHARVVVGHLHEWRVFTPERQVDWNGEDTFHYQLDRRYLTIVNAVQRGWCAVLDTDRESLEPIQVT